MKEHSFTKQPNTIKVICIQFVKMEQPISIPAANSHAAPWELLVEAMVQLLAVLEAELPGSHQLHLLQPALPGELPPSMEIELCRGRSQRLRLVLPRGWLQWLPLALPGELPASMEIELHRGRLQRLLCLVLPRGWLQLLLPWAAKANQLALPGDEVELCRGRSQRL